jgi:hypothetical protein
MNLALKELKFARQVAFFLQLKLRVQGEAVDSALEGEDDEQRIDDQVALVIAELGIAMKSTDDVRASSQQSLPPPHLSHRITPHRRLRFF